MKSGEYYNLVVSFGTTDVNITFQSWVINNHGSKGQATCNPEVRAQRQNSAYSICIGASKLKLIRFPPSGTILLHAHLIKQQAMRQTRHASTLLYPYISVENVTKNIN
jgi:hypothetical protein